MKVVKVHGALKERLGQGTFEFNVETPAQAIKALCANFSGLDKWLIDSDKDGVAYKVLVGRSKITQENIEELSYPWSEKEVFQITPVIAGAGRGFGQFVLGAALVGIGIASGGVGFGIFSATNWAGATFLTKSLITIGAGLALGGISTMLSPQPKLPKDARKNESFGFGGVENTVNQGVPVPICYGRLYVGSAAISVGLDTDQVV
tara:strand:+ start:2063 stop:2677 length:615 start_codon:yes stop_codon:yes gene_type:complete